MNQTEKLANLLADFAQTLGAGFRIQEILDHLVVRIVDVLPVSGAGVTVMGSRSDLRFVAATSEAILEIETLQNEWVEGPCLEAHSSGTPVLLPDLSDDERFLRFSRSSRAAGFEAVFSFPMSAEGVCFGALDLYRDQSGPLSADDTRWAQVLANVAAAYIRNAQGRSEAANTLDLLRARSLHDPLTGLPNRALLQERLEHATARSRRSQQLVAVLFVDIDRFKSVNDTFGHHVGDELLIAVAARLKEVVRAEDTLARLAGDEFVIVCEALDRAELAEHVAERVAAALEPPFQLEGSSISVTASVGLAFCGPGEEMPDTLMRNADFAMYQAKQEGGARHKVIDLDARRAMDRRARLANELHGALAREEFTVAYQPLVDVPRGSLVAVEALVRWNHPTRGLVMPGEILPLAEPTGMIVALGEWVLARACLDLRHWEQRFGPVVPQITVNVSAYQVMSPGFQTSLSRILEQTGTDPARVCLEVSENAFLEDGPRAHTVLRETKDVGVCLILDDFGTGYASLNYLRRFPFDVVKVDRVFLDNVDADKSARTVLASIVDLAHGLDLSVVAEGVETSQQLADVTELGADQAQGYYLCPPLPREELDRRVLEPAAGAPITFPLEPTTVS